MIRNVVGGPIGQSSLPYVTSTNNDSFNGIDAITLLGWVRNKMYEEQRAKLIEENPGLKAAHEAIVRAKENFDLLARIAASETA
jgi:hypothetical protein